MRRQLVEGEGLTMNEELPTVSQIYAKGIERLSTYPNVPSPYVDPFITDTHFDASVKANRRYLDSLFFVPRFFDPVAVDTRLKLFGVELRTPVFCSAISGLTRLSEDAFVEIAVGLKNAGSLMMLGIGGTRELQSAIDIGVPVAKIVKPYRRTELIYKKTRDAERRGCVAVGMDIDYFHGRTKGDRIHDSELFGPQNTDELRQLISQTRLPFIVKGVLSVSDAEKALSLGASAIVVSNHGSAAVDFTVPSMIALPRIVEAVGDKMAVLIDTGFRTGNDVLKALAFGARAVGLAVPIILAWGADGARGVESLVNQLTIELERTMAATGCPDLAAVDRRVITELPSV
jgi:4-hydroxymandelate oxidase